MCICVKNLKNTAPLGSSLWVHFGVPLSSLEQFHHLTKGQLVRFPLEGKIDTTPHIGGGHQQWGGPVWQFKLAPELYLLAIFSSRRIDSFLDCPFIWFLPCFQC